MRPVSTGPPSGAQGRGAAALVWVCVLAGAAGGVLLLMGTKPHPNCGGDNSCLLQHVYLAAATKVVFGIIVGYAVALLLIRVRYPRVDRRVAPPSLPPGTRYAPAPYLRAVVPRIEQMPPAEPAPRAPAPPAPAPHAPAPPPPARDAPPATGAASPLGMGARPGSRVSTSEILAGEYDPERDRRKGPSAGPPPGVPERRGERPQRGRGPLCADDLAGDLRTHPLLFVFRRQPRLQTFLEQFWKMLN